MPVYYLDTSAIVKRYRNEPGTEAIDRLFDSPQPDPQFYISFITILELTSSILRLVKGGQLGENVADDMLARFSWDIPGTFGVLPLTDKPLTGTVAVTGLCQLL